MRSFGRQCRGQGHVFVKLGRPTARQLLALGHPLTVRGPQAPQLLEQGHARQDVQRERLARELTAAMHAHERIRKQAGQRTQGQKLRHGNIGNA